MPAKSSLVPDFLGKTVDNGRLLLHRVLGSGAYGVCYEARCVNENSEGPKSFAVKCIIKVGLDDRQRMFQRRELKLHAAASAHPGVVTLHRVFEEGSCVFLVLDLAEGDLFSMITEKHIYLGRDALIKHVFCQLIDALEYCHTRGIYHRDLKPENILCIRGGSKVMISDFGLATADPVSNDFGCGSSYYMSPECHGGVFHRVTAYATRQNDIWALGVILVNLTCGRNPWRQAGPADDTFRAYVRDRDFLPNILPVSYACNQILKRIFTIEPKDRITLPELRQAIRKVERFTMTNEELRRAPEACKAAARAAWTDAQKVARRNLLTVPPIIVDELSPPIADDDVSVAPSDEGYLPDDNLTRSFSAGSEHVTVSPSDPEQAERLDEPRCVASRSVSSLAHEVPGRSSSTLSSSSTVAESDGPITPEWNPNADNAAALPDVNEEPLDLNAAPAASAGKPKVVGGLTAERVQKDAPSSTMRGVKDLWKRVRA